MAVCGDVSPCHQLVALTFCLCEMLRIVYMCYILVNVICVCVCLRERERERDREREDIRWLQVKRGTL